MRMIQKYADDADCGYFIYQQSVNRHESYLSASFINF